jgi:HEAT repeat protein
MICMELRVQRRGPHGHRSLDWLLSEMLRIGPENDLYGEYLHAIFRRGTWHTFRRAVALCHSDVPAERELGADCLSQLGHTGGEGPFDEAAAAALLTLFSYTDAPTLRGAASAVGWLDCPAAIPHLLELTDHAEACVRGAVTWGLNAYTRAGGSGKPQLLQPEVMRALITLSGDADRDVRDWSSFWLASLLQTDFDDQTEPGYDVRDEVVVALWRCADDEDLEVRHQALGGLALGREPGVLTPLLAELENAALGGDWYSDLLEAAETLADPALAPPLRRILASGDFESWHKSSIQAAIEACSGTADTAG